MNYLVNNIYGCVQGEGCNAGLPMVMLRLHGCGVGCPWCDTKETWEVELQNERLTIKEVLGSSPFYTTKTELEITDYITGNFLKFKWILISGGEPARYTLKPLVYSLQQAGYKVALETSGTELGHVGAGIDWVCISPKIDMPGGKKVISEAFREADEIKHVIGKLADLEALNNLLSQVAPYLCKEVQICLQPVSQSEKATKLCIDEVQKRGWRLSVQLHKYINVD